jgi:hypothetical protein
LADCSSSISPLPCYLDARSGGTRGSRPLRCCSCDWRCAARPPSVPACGPSPGGPAVRPRPDRRGRSEQTTEHSAPAPASSAGWSRASPGATACHDVPGGRSLAARGRWLVRRRLQGRPLEPRRAGRPRAIFQRNVEAGLTKWPCSNVRPRLCAELHAICRSLSTTTAGRRIAIRGWARWPRPGAASRRPGPSRR